MKVKSIVTIIAFFSMMGISNAQESQKSSTETPLAGLVKAGEGDLDPSKHLRLDAVTIPVYFENGTQIKVESFGLIMMSNEYVPEPYIDKNKEVKAFVLRKATDEEKKQMKESFNKNNKTKTN